MGNKEHRPILIVIAGPNGSGKTSVTSRLLKHEWMEDSVYINPDNVAKDVFGDWNSKESVLKAANYCAEWREKCLAEKKSLIFETVMSADDQVDYIERAKKAGKEESGGNDRRGPLPSTIIPLAKRVCKRLPTKRRRFCEKRSPREKRGEKKSVCRVNDERL